jgi:hypothetical protein
MGLDFGTSCAKVIIGDNAIQKAFAVQFRNAAGLQGYLLPCRLFQESSRYSLAPIGDPLADLKLSLLSDPNNSIYQHRVVAFLGLVIRRARAWFLEAHKSVYMSENIIWRISLGLPSANHLKAEQKGIFETLAMSAWIVAGNSSQEICDSRIAAALQRSKELANGSLPKEHEDVVISVVPEIAAQIYGYVASEKFDKKAPNNFLIVDIGAGTVDASLFHVAPTKGRWDFNFYTATVEPYGTVNLHRNRLRWWDRVIQECYVERSDLLDAIYAELEWTDSQAGIPERIQDYFSSTKIEFNDEENPDQTFFNRVFKQIGNQTYFETYKELHLGKEDLKNMPMYICGGGARMEFYNRLKENMSNHHSFLSWMKADYRQLSVPKGLIAPGLPPDCYDRLSVAYGLSFLNVGEILKSVPMPRIPVVSSDHWRDNYIEK